MQVSRRALLKLCVRGLLYPGAFYSTLIEPQRPSLVRIQTRIPRLPTALEGLRIAVLGDFHLHPFTRLSLIQRAIDLANSIKPDLAVLLGDYVDSTVDAIYELAPALANLNARLGVFGVLGNHDHWKGASIVEEALERSGISVLNNSSVAVANGALFLAGLDSICGGFPNVHAAFDDQPIGIPTVLLVHEPDFADTAFLHGRVMLQISGHSHGGQVRLPFVGGIVLPDWGRRYDHGLYRVRDMLVYTNRGLGVVNIPVRFNCSPEVTEITLCAA